MTRPNALFFIIAGLIVAATLVVYGEAYKFEFLSFDDNFYVTTNPNIGLGLTIEGIKWAFTTTYASFWHPLTWLSLMLDYKLYGLNAGGFHVTNLIFHLANTVLLFWLFLRMTKALWPSAFVAALFALHPLHIESVAWVAERKDVLSTFFWFLTMLAYLRYTETRTKLRYLAVIVFFALGLMAKPMLVTLPFVLLLMDYWPLNRLSKSSILEKLPLIFISIFFSIAAFTAQEAARARHESLSKLWRLADAIFFYAQYLAKTFWPTKLAILYPHPGDTVPHLQILLAVILFVCICAAVVTGRKYRWLTVGWLWFVGTLVPVIGIVPLGDHGIADRYTYIPLIGIFVIIGWGGRELLPQWKSRNLLLGVSAIILLSILSVCSQIQLGYWRNNEALYRRALSVTKDNFLMSNNLGSVLLRQNKFPEAELHFREAYRLSPDTGYICYNLATALARQNKFGEASEFFDKALKLEPANANTFYNYGLMLSKKKDYPAAIDKFDKALQADPNHAMAHNNIGFIYSEQNKIDKAIFHYEKAAQINPANAETHYMLGTLFARTATPEKAEPHFLEALKFDPSHQDAAYDLARMYLRERKYEQAIIYFKKTLQINPSFSAAQTDLQSAVTTLQKANACYKQAVTLHKEGKIEQCLQYYRQALLLKPDRLEGLNNLAWLLATNPKVLNPVEAVRLAERAAELTNYNQPGILDTLAAAYAANGDFAKAVETAQKAVDLAKSSQLAETINAHLELYKKGIAYIEPAE